MAARSLKSRLDKGRPARAPASKKATGTLTKNIEIVYGPGAATNRFEMSSKSAETYAVYASACKSLEKYCRDRGCRAMPAEIATIKSWLAAMAEGGKSLATILLYLSGISASHAARGHVLDRRLLASTIRGIRREADPQRQAAPLLDADLQGILAMLDPTKARDARDGALLSIAWGGAFRRSEVASLDWKRPGSRAWRGRGVLRLNEKGIEVELHRSKTSQTAIAMVPISAEHMPTATMWLGRYLDMAQIAPGSPLFRSIGKSGNVSSKRLSPKSVGQIARDRTRALLVARGTPLEDAIERSDSFSGHSLRAGYATSAGLAKVEGWQIMNHMRHKDFKTTVRYIRRAETMAENGLIGVGF